jgi:hypothetical protein
MINIQKVEIFSNEIPSEINFLCENKKRHRRTAGNLICGKNSRVKKEIWKENSIPEKKNVVEIVFEIQFAHLDVSSQVPENSLSLPIFEFAFSSFAVCVFCSL